MPLPPARIMEYTLFNISSHRGLVDYGFFAQVVFFLVEINVIVNIRLLVVVFFFFLIVFLLEIDILVDVVDY